MRDDLSCGGFCRNKQIDAAYSMGDIKRWKCGGKPSGGRTYGRRTDRHKFHQNWTSNIIGTNLLTKFHENRKKNVASRENAPPPGSHVFQPTGIIFELVQDIFGMNLLTKFHEDRTVNVTSRVLTRFDHSHIRKNVPPLGSHVF
ncbi:hypothetical protein DPMN_004317 [Dreissena polymorpha]|uniref:Uncharacterized protein n=1 Tax=Dreissena polymorpha TaxID=45954 RepID=A0A9D4MQ11_DREPO|nr:hypothetical protein DPMN_004317 [Dreissena polymorpha]